MKVLCNLGKAKAKQDKISINNNFVGYSYIYIYIQIHIKYKVIKVGESTLYTHCILIVKLKVGE